MRNSGGEQTAGARGRAGRRRDREQTRTDQVQAAECEDSLTQRHPAPPKPIHSRSPRTIVRGLAHKVAGQAAQRLGVGRVGGHRARISSHTDGTSGPGSAIRAGKSPSCEDWLTHRHPQPTEPASRRRPRTIVRGLAHKVAGQAAQRGSFPRRKAIVRGFTHTTICRTAQRRRVGRAGGHRVRIHSHTDGTSGPGSAIRAGKSPSCED